MAGSGLLAAAAAGNIRDDMCANFGNRGLTSTRSFIHRTLVLMVFFFAIAAVPFAAHATDALQAANHAKAFAATQEDLATLKKRQSLAEEFYVQGKYAQAEAEWRGVLSIYKRLFGPTHPYVFQTCYSLADCLAKQNKMQEANQYARMASGAWTGESFEANVQASASKKQLKPSERPEKQMWGRPDFIMKWLGRGYDWLSEPFRLAWIIAAICFPAAATYFLLRWLFKHEQ